MAGAVLSVGGQGEGVGGEGGAGGRDQVVGVGWVGFIVYTVAEDSEIVSQ